MRKEALTHIHIYDYSPYNKFNLSGLSNPEKLTADAALAKNQGRDTKVWCENLNKIGESGIRNAFRARENKLRQWREHLNKEVDKYVRDKYVPCI